LVNKNVQLNKENSFLFKKDIIIDITIEREEKRERRKKREKEG
jgi:hypothetical protein